jgi:hypothetical protein
MKFGYEDIIFRCFEQKISTFFLKCNFYSNLDISMYILFLLTIIS